MQLPRSLRFELKLAHKWKLMFRNAFRMLEHSRPGLCANVTYALEQRVRALGYSLVDLEAVGGSSQPRARRALSQQGDAMQGSNAMHSRPMSFFRSSKGAAWP